MNAPRQGVRRRHGSGGGRAGLHRLRSHRPATSASTTTSDPRHAATAAPNGDGRPVRDLATPTAAPSCNAWQPCPRASRSRSLPGRYAIASLHNGVPPQLASQLSQDVLHGAIRLVGQHDPGREDRLWRIGPATPFLFDLALRPRVQGPVHRPHARRAGRGIRGRRAPRRHRRSAGHRRAAPDHGRDRGRPRRERTSTTPSPPIPRPAETGRTASGSGAPARRR